MPLFSIVGVVPLIRQRVRVEARLEARSGVDRIKFNFKLHCAWYLRGLSLGVFQEMKPCFARRVRQDTCRCRYCDDMSLMLKALRKHSHLLQ